MADYERIYIGSPEAIVGGWAISYCAQGGQWFVVDTASSLFVYTKAHSSNVIRATTTYNLPSTTEEVCIIRAALYLRLHNEVCRDNEISDKKTYLIECVRDVDHHLVFENIKANSDSYVKIAVEATDGVANAILITCD